MTHLFFSSFPYVNVTHLLKSTLFHIHKQFQTVHPTNDVGDQIFSSLCMIKSTGCIELWQSVWKSSLLVSWKCIAVNIGMKVIPTWKAFLKIINKSKCFSFWFNRYFSKILQIHSPIHYTTHSRLVPFFLNFKKSLLIYYSVKVDLFVTFYITYLTHWVSLLAHDFVWYFYT